jgi:site-specific DNA-methyltransferase (adenine-specific)
METNRILLGNNLDLLRAMPSNSVDSVVTDPPYGISFMNKKWDYDVPSVETWTEVLRVLKPGGHALVACGTRTQHRMACNLEDAGFEIRDIVAWIYGSGFPKSLDIGKAIESKIINGKSNSRTLRKTEQDGDGTPYKLKGKNNGIMGEEREYDRKDFSPATPEAQQWNGWGTALKPAMELFTLCRKPTEGTIAENVLKYGTGGINIDGCRVGNGREQQQQQGVSDTDTQVANRDENNLKIYPVELGRFPANVIHDGSDEVVKLFPQSGNGTFKQGSERKAAPENLYQLGFTKSAFTPDAPDNYGDIGSAARFFYTAKAQRGERDMGLATVRETKIELGGSLCQDEIMELVELLKKVTSELTVKWNIDESGNSITAQCQVDSLFITLMEIKKITPLKISPYLTPLLINGFTLGANLLRENGGSHVATAENSNEFQPIITNELTESVRGASLAVWKMLQEINVAEKWKVGRNTHSTVKPVDLMRYLVRLITPKGGIVLDPYLGSGSTAVAAKLEGMQYIGMEREPQYVLIAEGRVKECESDYETKAKIYEDKTVSKVYDIFDYLTESPKRGKEKE